MTDSADWSQHPLARRALAKGDQPTPMTHLHHAARHGWLEDIEVELDEGADIEAPTADQHQWTPLHWAALSGQTAAVRLLLTRGANINSLESKGSSPLMFAIHGKHVETAYVLLEAGADTRVVNEAGRTAEELASHYDPELQAAVRRYGLNKVAGVSGEQAREKPIF
ncbi:hypothetical protein CSC66_13975 [Pseudoxanthomonas kaohsiungensis]|nr:hypothetical protein CSC66_13975 [Pseudoxanthomonas kaohsiungensis]